jgi:cytochrome c
MNIFRISATAAGLVALAAIAATASAADGKGDRATAREVVEKVREAAAYLKRTGVPGLKAFHGKSSRYVWKDSYVFVSDCDRGVILAHPFQPKREGKRIADGPTYGGMTAAQRAEAQCAAARKPGGGWWAYKFSHPGSDKPVRKVSYMVMVSGRPWLVGAGVYDETTPIEAFEKLSRGTP